jgi:hypothetical protein
MPHSQILVKVSSCIHPSLLLYLAAENFFFYKIILYGSMSPLQPKAKMDNPVQYMYHKKCCFGFAAKLQQLNVS